MEIVTTVSPVHRLHSVTPDPLSLALPYGAAALAQITAGIVRRLGGHFTRLYFERLETEPLVPEMEAQLAPKDRPHRITRDVLPDEYRVGAIMSVTSKNAEGVAALTGSITLAGAVLGSGLITSSVWYAIAAAVPVALGLGTATWFWIRDPEKYKDRRLLGISRSAVILAVVNVVLGVVVAVVH